MAKPGLFAVIKLASLMLVNGKDVDKIAAATDKVYADMEFDFFDIGLGDEKFMLNAMYVVCGYQYAGQFEKAADLAILARKKFDSGTPITRSVAAIFHAGSWSCAIAAGLNKLRAKDYLQQGKDMANLALIGFSTNDPGDKRTAALLGTKALINHQIERLGFLKDGVFSADTPPKTLLQQAFALNPKQHAAENPDAWPKGAVDAVDHSWRNLLDEVANIRPQVAMKIR